jgi:hypothetical protein
MIVITPSAPPIIFYFSLLFSPLWNLSRYKAPLRLEFKKFDIYDIHFFSGREDPGKTCKDVKRKGWGAL